MNLNQDEMYREFRESYVIYQVDKEGFVICVHDRLSILDESLKDSLFNDYLQEQNENY